MKKLTPGTKFQFHGSDAIGTIQEASPANISYRWAHDADERTYNMSEKHFRKVAIFLSANV
ncbi:hypothetical protein [Glutamicibacter creatinolyticus]|uniref:hypothetical protein n=1 Tax=Glutamicibacter creatinolyticus TaxID=162496 RepID=UPI003217C7B6